jgi:hypothetical protein
MVVASAAMETPPAPAPSRDLINRFVEYARTTFVPALDAFYEAGSAHVGSFSVMPDEMMPANVGAFYITAKPQSPLLEALTGGAVTPITAMYVTMSTAISVASVLEGRSQLLPDPIRRDVLTQFKTQLKFVVHEATHSIGADDLDEFHAESERTARAGLTPWKEALTELATQKNLDAIIRAARLDRSDPWLLSVKPQDTGSYVGMVDAADVFIRGMAALIPGADPAKELNALVGAGCGRTGLENLVRRAAEARGVTDDRLVGAGVGMVARNLAQLDSQYKRTLARLDNVDRHTAAAAMEQLRRQGSATGVQMVEQFQRALGEPRSAARPTMVSSRPSALDDLRRTLERAFGGGPERDLQRGDDLRGFGVLVGH